MSQDFSKSNYEGLVRGRIVKDMIKAVRPYSDLIVYIFKCELCGHIEHVVCINEEDISWQTPGKHSCGKNETGWVIGNYVLTGQINDFRTVMNVVEEYAELLKQTIEEKKDAKISYNIGTSASATESKALCGINARPA